MLEWDAKNPSEIQKGNSALRVFRWDEDAVQETPSNNNKKHKEQSVQGRKQKKVHKKKFKNSKKNSKEAVTHVVPPTMSTS